MGRPIWSRVNQADYNDTMPGIGFNPPFQKLQSRYR
ncbi:MAG: hypothetical protein QOI94_2126, partial [Acidobacteriaceae bacterium]|nr:hypothetical protein [Acidobacteriaceae bacterium]